MGKLLFVAFTLAMALAACGKTEGPKPAATDAAAVTAAPAAPATTAGTDEEKEKIRKQNAAAEAALSGH